MKTKYFPIILNQQSSSVAVTANATNREGLIKIIFSYFITHRLRQRTLLSCDVIFNFWADHMKQFTLKQVNNGNLHNSFQHFVGCSHPIKINYLNSSSFIVFFFLTITNWAILADLKAFERTLLINRGNNESNLNQFFSFSFGLCIHGFLKNNGKTASIEV